MTVALVFDTAGPVVGVALVRGAEAWWREARAGSNPDRLLLPWTQELLAEAGLGIGEIDVIGVAAGPGGFTGLRVGIAVAAGLAFALQRPLWSGSSLASRARAAAAGQPDAAASVILAMLDARKGRVYAAAWAGDEGVFEPSDEPPDVVLARLPAGFLATGEGALVYRQAVEAAGGVVWTGSEGSGVVELARMCARGYEGGEALPPAEVRPLYLRDPDIKVPAQVAQQG